MDGTSHLFGGYARQRKERKSAQSGPHVFFGMDSCRMDTQEFPSPDCSVKSVARTIKSEPNRRLLVFMFGKYAINMGKMVLQSQ